MSRFSKSWLLPNAAFCALVVLAATLPLDYDEILHAHSAWLVSQKLVPYTDFLALHPPFFWFLFAPLLKIFPETFGVLIALRLANFVFSLAALNVLMVLMRRSLEGPAAALASSMAVLLALVQPSVAHALIEFRPDHVSLLLIFLGLASGDRRKWFLHGLFMTLGVLINPKLFLLPLLSGGLFFIVVVRQDATAGRRWLAQTAAGILAMYICLIESA
jgi:hypothetical protein